MSGTSLAPSFGTPVPACQTGLDMNALDPPPPAANPVEAPLMLVFVSFHAVSGI
jgi:hypothetical protein